jgi:hypothetical protein
VRKDKQGGPRRYGMVSQTAARGRGISVTGVESFWVLTGRTVALCGRREIAREGKGEGLS